MTALPSVMLCPAGTVNAASSRLRCFVLARELQRLGCSVQLGFDASVLPALLYVQKTSSPEIIAHARRVRASGGHVVFDIDDWGDALPWVQSQPELLAGLLAHCDAVSVDTAMRAEVLAREAAYRDVPAFWVVPDPVDYIDDAAIAPARDPARRAAGCWFGNGPNLPPALPYIQAAMASDRLERFDIITNAQFVPQMQQAWPMLGVEAWQLETFPQRLREHDFCLLIHDTGLEGIQKSNNKMLAALGQGVVPLVSNTPAYAETAARVGLPELVLEHTGDIVARLAPERLASLLAGVRGEACRNALRDFMPGAVARGFLERVMALRAATPPAAPAAAPGPAAAPPPAPAGTTPPLVQLGTGNVIELGANVELSGYVNGNNNRIVIAGADSPTRLRILVHGHGNRITIDGNTELKGLLVCCGNHVQAHDTELHIGANTTVEGGGRFFLYNSGNVLHIGSNTMLSSGITIRCGESPHLLFKQDSGEYLDRSRGVFIGDHVWIGENAYLTKSAHIADDCVVGACSVVTRRFERSHVALAGNPARVVREGVQWIRNPGKLEPGTPYEAAYREHMAHFPRADAADLQVPLADTGQPQDSNTMALTPSAESRTRSAEAPPVLPDRPAGPARAKLPAPEDGPVRLNLGCGDVPLTGYINVDVAAERAGRQPDVCCDIRDLSAFPDGYADEVMAIHVIEHFYRWEVVDLLKEWVRVLKPGGRLVLECPNLLAACEELLKNPELASRPDQAGQRSMWCLYGDPAWQDPLMCHRWLYTPQSLAQVMHEAGLRELAQKPPVFKAGHPRDMRVEGTKPAAT